MSKTFHSFIQTGLAPKSFDPDGLSCQTVRAVVLFAPFSLSQAAYQADTWHSAEVPRSWARGRSPLSLWPDLTFLFAACFTSFLKDRHHS